MSNIEKRKELIKNWFKNRYNLTFAIIILAAFIIRLIFFIKTMNQPVWWDEGEYLSMALSFAKDIPFNFNPQRPFLLPAIMSIFMFLGASEAVIRFFTILLPSLGTVIVTYLFTKELYNKKTALITSTLMAFFWVSLFNTTRIHTDMPSLFFGLLSLFFFWKFYVKNNNIRYLWLFGLFLAIAFMFRPSAILIGVAILIYVLITDKHKIIFKKELWLALVIFFLALAPMFLWNLNVHGNILAQTSGYVDTGSLEEKSSRPLTWNVFNIIPIFLMPDGSFLGIIAIILLIIGVITILDLFLGFDLIIKNKGKKLKPHLMVIILALLPILYFLIIERPIHGFEPRWMLISAIGVFILIARGLTKIEKLLSKKINKIVPLLAIILLTILIILPQISHSNNTIESKKESYLQVKEAGLWIKENSNSDEVIYTQSPTQNTYYSERHSKGIPGTYEDFIINQKEDNARYFIVSIFEKHPDWAYSYPQENQDEFIPVQAYFQNENQPILVIYNYVPKN